MFYIISKYVIICFRKKEIIKLIIHKDRSVIISEIFPEYTWGDSFSESFTYVKVIYNYNQLYYILFEWNVYVITALKTFI